MSHPTPPSPCPHARRHFAAETPSETPDIWQDNQGVWHLNSYTLAKTFLRHQHTRQHGFAAERLYSTPRTFMKRYPILFQEGKEHHQQRSETMRFFTPAAIATKHHEMITTTADTLIQEFVKKGQADLSQMSLLMAVKVASVVVGLDQGDPHKMARRLERFFQLDLQAFSWRKLHLFFIGQATMSRFFYKDVKPAVRKRRKALEQGTPYDDVITHLITKGHKDREILSECLMYGAAGMITTREFIAAAVWHLLKDDALKTQYLCADEETRYHLLHEILRVEPVVNTVVRQTTAEVELQSHDQTYTFPQGSVVEVHLNHTNADPYVASPCPAHIMPARTLEGKVHPSLLSFGEGVHRCAGAYLAIYETDIFLQRLLKHPIAILQEPEVGWLELAKGYEVHRFMIGLA